MRVPNATSMFPIKPKKPGRTPTPTTKAKEDATTGSIKVATEMTKLSKYWVDRRYPIFPVFFCLTNVDLANTDQIRPAFRLASGAGYRDRRPRHDPGRGRGAGLPVRRFAIDCCIEDISTSPSASVSAANRFAPVSVDRSD